MTTTAPTDGLFVSVDAHGEPSVWRHDAPRRPEFIVRQLGTHPAVWQIVVAAIRAARHTTRGLEADGAA